jgi:hypothetical protein
VKTRARTGVTAALLPILADGEWHTLAEVEATVRPFVVEGGNVQEAASEMASSLKCERMGIRGRNDQQVRWRPDLYLESNEATHERGNFKAGADTLLKALLGIRSFQQLIVQPGQQLNPAQRYWLDKALRMTGARIAEGGGD